jgi:poly(A) polymerase
METYTLAKEVVLKITRAGYRAYFAGGWVRDYLMESPSSDIDIATDAPPEVILDLFPRTIIVGLAFGIVVVVVQGHQFEVATFRRDIDYVDGRKPTKIELATPEEDASRRDFTINGMFYDPLENVVYDFVNGKQDIKNGIIKTIGNPRDRFFEDRLRMIRAIRFSARFDFPIEPDTRNAIVENAETLFPAVAIERVWQEFNKMIEYPGFEKALIEMHRLGLLQVIFPLLRTVHLEEIKRRVKSFSQLPKKFPTILYLLDLFSESSLEELFELCLYLKVSGKEKNLMEFAYKSKQMLTKENIDLFEMTHFYANENSHYVLQLLSVKLSDLQKNEFNILHHDRQKCLQKHIQRVRDKKPLVNAQALQQWGIPKGKILGALLKEAERLSINKKINDVQQIIVLLKQSSLWPNEEPLL